MRNRLGNEAGEGDQQGSISGKDTPTPGTQLRTRLLLGRTVEDTPTPWEDS